MELFYVPFIIQSLLMGIDEYFHGKRGLGKWERLGHPLDTLTAFFPLAFTLLNQFSNEKLKIYLVLSIFSCVFITKDEFVHSKECGALENWIHALLFILHPIIFLSTGLLWKNYPQSGFLIIQTVMVGLFLVYQVLRWSIQWKPQAG